MIKVSVVVSVYNGEKYIEKCIKSILRQSYKNIELIVVNDGSIDKTKKILDKYKESIVVINKNNTGVSDSRNRGIDKATGEYIMFCDADDWLDKKAVELAINEIKDKDYDAIRFTHFNTTGKKMIKKNNKDDIYSDINIDVSADELVKNLVCNKTEGHLWNYLLKKEIIKKNNMSFDKQLFYQEDVIFLLEYFFKSKKIKVISNPLYYYYQNNESVTRAQKSSIKNLSSIGYLREKMLKILKENNKENYIPLMEQRFLNLQLMYFLEYQSKLKRKEFIKYIKEVSSGCQDYYEAVEKTNLSKKWLYFITLLKKSKPNLFNIYLHIYMIIKKK